MDMGNNLDNQITDDNSNLTQENTQNNNETIQETSQPEDNSQGMMDHSQMACSQGNIL